ncbi:MAG: hypothetical protein WAW85_13585 [Gordonia sp. (in: high G+C Gram-positive bacteria)]|uniref:hypothetical protein n=1 Tax=Gordonia sp. (in: high G+C Gram-positive bacteria) TaxID=84139 RepID=UPI003BB5144B
MRRPAAPADRRLVAVCLTAVVLSVIAALVAGAVWLTREATDEGERIVVEEAAAAAVGELMTFAPDDDRSARVAVADRLTGSLAADYLTRGPDLVFPGATASQLTMATTVVDVGVTELVPRRARALVFADQAISTPGTAGEPERIAVVRWATMTKHGDRWLLTRLETVAAR